MATKKLSKTKIVLVEDDNFLAGMYVTKLQLEGFDVHLAADGEKGLKLVKEERPAVILLDIVLPKMSGFDVLKDLKSEATTKDIPVILLTNLGQRDDVKKGLSLGAVDYLIKAHFMPSEVVEKIKKLVKRG
jgi:DNA-binding response OmpR family regulator